MLRDHTAGSAAIAAYDALAAEYDEQQRGDEWMRRKLHAHYLRVFGPGQRVLDLGCGTGTDALVLAAHGVQVVGIDGSAAMIDQLQRKAGGLVHGRVLALAELAHLEGRFDGAYSSFAGLSTVDLAAFATDAARLIGPGGRMVLHLLNRVSLWEWLGSGRLRPPAASLRSFTIASHAVQHRLYLPREAYRHFEASFALRETYSLGALRPPHTVRRVPLTRTLEALDVRLGGLPGLRSLGRFFVLDLERRS